jgi:hypothetical protein
MTTGSADPSGWSTAWAHALDAVELDLDEAERLLERLHADTLDPVAALTVARGAWTPPVGLGPLPESMEERARTVLARQLDVAERLVVAAVHSRQQLAFARHADVSPPARPLFVDAAC